MAAVTQPTSPANGRGEQAEHVEGQVIAYAVQQLRDFLVGELAQSGSVRTVRQHVLLVRRERCQRVNRVDVVGQPGYRRLAISTPAGLAGQPPGDAVAAGTQILIQPVNDQQQLPVFVRGALRGPAPTAAGTRARPARTAGPCQAARPAAAQ